MSLGRGIPLTTPSMKPSQEDYSVTLEHAAAKFTEYSMLKARDYIILAPSTKTRLAAKKQLFIK